MAEDIKRQEEFIQNIFPEYEICEIDNSTKPGINNKDRFPTDMRIKKKDMELNIQFTELETTDYATSYRANTSKYKRNNFSDFLNTYIKDRKKFEWDNNIQLFDEKLVYQLIEYIIQGKIRISDICTNIETEEEWRKNKILLEKLSNIKGQLEIKKIFKELLEYEKLNLRVINIHKVEIVMRVKENHFPYVENYIQFDFMPAYCSDIEVGLKKVLKNKNKYKKNEKEILDNWNIRKENHILVCHIFEYIAPIELNRIKDIPIISYKYKEIYVTYDNMNYVKIVTSKKINQTLQT